MKRFADYQLALVVFTGACLMLTASAHGLVTASGGNQLAHFACDVGPVAIGSDDAYPAIQAVVTRAAQLQSRTGQPLLPAGTTVDGVTWNGPVVEILLTVPATDWILAPTDLEMISQALGEPFAGDPAFGGTWTQVRRTPDEAYGTWEQFMLYGPPRPVSEEQVAETPLPADRTHVGDVVIGERGPTTQATRQPTGALTGVTLFASAGHGWTAGDSSWYLQRPVLWSMNEDHGNIDQLNYLVQYAFNAGATVVPFRPVGWQPIEIVLDNDDPGVTYTGTWTNGSSSKYYENGVTSSGIAYKWTSATATETATARFEPNITVTDFYPVYCFAVAGTNRTLQTYRVGHSGGISEITVDHREVGNGWIWLGDYYLVAGGDNYVEIPNASPEDGAIIADAIRWGCGEGDISRPGPGSISGHQRDEECQRYWAHSELGNHAVGFDADIWDISGYDDGDDNIRCAAKWAREMNQSPTGGVLVDRWKRIHLELHTNASSGAARGQICLLSDLGMTTYQQEYATILSNEIDADMATLDGQFEHTWVDRTSATVTGSYGAICTPANGNEFDATIAELAFHDNELDAQLLRDDRVRAALARACVQGIIRFLNTLPGSEVPLAFLPDTPREVRAEDIGNGNVLIAWQPPLSDEARGDPATGYVVYQSSNGYGFGDPIVLDNVQSTTITGVPVGETRYFRVAATNAGGESMPSEVLAVRRPAEGIATVVVVDGFDALWRWQNPTQAIGSGIERQIWRRSNSYDYVVAYAEALAAAGYGFSSCSNEAVANSGVQLGDYDVAVWILGNESTQDATFTSLERSKVENFLFGGGGLFVSGAEIGYDLIGQGHGVSFMQDTLRTGYSADDAGTYYVTATSGGILAGLGTFNFNPANGAPYNVYSPDVLTASSGAQACVNYTGGTGGVAGVQYDAGFYGVVVFGFPFETITSPTVRATIMDAVVAFLLLPDPLCFDYNQDYAVTLMDLNYFLWCFQGPDDTFVPGHICVDVNCEQDLDLDMEDFALFQRSFTGQ